jgi:AcrR family transcriptional regulator
VSRQAVYLHWASKADLLTDLVAWVEEQEDLGGLLEPVWSAETGEQALDRLIDVGAVFEPRIQALAGAMRRAVDLDPMIEALTRDRMVRRYEAMRGVVARIEGEGRLAPGWDVDTAAAFVWALTTPVVFDLLVDQRGWSAEQWAASTKKLLRDAIVGR